MNSIHWTWFHSCISVNTENLGWRIFQLSWGMEDIKKWGDPISGGGFEMERGGGGGVDTPLRTMILLLAPAASIVFVSRFTASSGTTVLWNLRLPISCIISKGKTHTDLRSSSIASFQLRFLLTSVCKSIIIAVLIGAIFPVKSKISVTFGVQFCFVNLYGMMFYGCTGFFSLLLFSKI